jgi:hypothetical protein
MIKRFTHFIYVLIQKVYNCKKIVSGKKLLQIVMNN